VQRRAGRRVREIGATDGLLLNSLLLLSPAERTGGSSGAGGRRKEERAWAVVAVAGFIGWAD
jgi:hypothetical protein